MLQNRGFMWNYIPVAGTVCAWRFPNDSWKWQVFTEHDSLHFSWGVAHCCILGAQKSNLLMKKSEPLGLTWKTQEPPGGLASLFFPVWLSFLCSWSSQLFPPTFFAYVHTSVSSASDLFLTRCNNDIHNFSSVLFSTNRLLKEPANVSPKLDLSLLTE